MDRLDQLPCPVLITDERGRILSVNQELQTLLNLKNHDESRTSLEQLFPAAGRIFLQTHLWPMLLGEGVIREAYVNLVDGNSQRIPVLLNSRKGEFDGIPCYYWVFFVAQERSRFEVELVKARGDAQRMSESLALANVNLELLHAQLAQRAQEIERANLELSALSQSDPLTGLGNRRALSVAIKNWQASARADAHASLLLVDVDHFKSINDEFGHDEGDRVLVALAKGLQQSVGPEGLAIRYGGEEFAMWLPSADRAMAEETAQALHTQVRHVRVVRRGITVSVGVATGKNFFGPKLMHRLIAQSDKAVYIAKASGRNRTEHFERRHAARLP